MECGTQLGVEQSAHTSQADATRMHVTRGFYPGKGAKHNLGQGQRVRQKQKEGRRSRRSRRAPERLRRPERPC
jgi:hypothetical protein